MQVHRHLHVFLEGFHQVEGVVGGHQACHILDADRVRAHVLQLFGFFHVVVDVIDVSAHALFGEAVADRSLKVFLVLFDDLHRGLEVAEVVERVKDPDDVDAVVAGTLHEGFHHVVGVVLVAHQVLPAQEHGEGGLFDVFFEGADAFPGVFAQIAVHGVEGGSAPHFHAVKAHLVHQFRHVEHVFGAPAGGKQRLMPVAERQVLDLYRVGRLGAVSFIAHCCFGQDAMFIHGCSFLSASFYYSALDQVTVQHGLLPAIGLPDAGGVFQGPLGIDGRRF